MIAAARNGAQTHVAVLRACFLWTPVRESSGESHLWCTKKKRVAAAADDEVCALPHQGAQARCYCRPDAGVGARAVDSRGHARIKRSAGAASLPAPFPTAEGHIRGLRRKFLVHNEPGVEMEASAAIEPAE